MSETLMPRDLSSASTPSVWWIPANTASISDKLDQALSRRGFTDDCRVRARRRELFER